MVYPEQEYIKGPLGGLFPVKGTFHYHEKCDDDCGAYETIMCSSIFPPFRPKLVKFCGSNPQKALSNIKYSCHWVQ